MTVSQLLKRINQQLQQSYYLQFLLDTRTLKQPLPIKYDAKTQSFVDKSKAPIADLVGYEYKTLYGSLILLSKHIHS